MYRKSLGSIYFELTNERVDHAEHFAIGGAGRNVSVADRGHNRYSKQQRVLETKQ